MISFVAGFITGFVSKDCGKIGKVCSELTVDVTSKVFKSVVKACKNKKNTVNAKTSKVTA